MIRLPALTHAFGRVAFTLLAGIPLASLALAADAADAWPSHYSSAPRSAHAGSGSRQATAPSTWTVNNTADSYTDGTAANCVADNANTCSLRDAIAASGDGDTIVFSNLFDTPQTINVDQTLVITTSVTITGPGTSLLTLTANGGGNYSIIESNSGTVAISGMTIAGGFHGVGGALANLTDLTVSDVIFRNNNASDQGGAIFNAGTLHVDRSTFTGNAAHFGGALFNTTSGTSVGVATITNSTFFGNMSLYPYLGSAIATYGSGSNGGTAAIHLQNCTIAGNKGVLVPVLVAIYSGGGPASLDLVNTIISGNDGVSFDVINGAPGNYTSLGNNLSSDNGSGVLVASGDLINSNPLLSKLGNYGGTTPTLYPMVGSPAIDAGASTGEPATDQRGVTRPQGNGYDIGAVEANGELLFQNGFDS